MRIKQVVSPAAAMLLMLGGLAGWASPSQASPDASSDASATVANANAELEQSFRYAGGNKGRVAIEQAVDEAIADMSPLIRGIARTRLLEVNTVIETIDFSLGSDTLRTSYIGGRIIESPASGAAVRWVNQFGDTVNVSQRWSDGKLVQRIFDGNGSRTNVYRFSEDGQSMTMSVTIKADRLPKPIRYRLRYGKKGS
ncbi:hypothetical protein [Paraliomyxa miuraensis]|uniref:hypothetical protein n=1 Tax=Paraliomyxa miuraensis TaxID=376150 RepID=UPI00225540D9|nr:hypothetical protein [Paraliomyxa miuraensis]MCX4241730.1 hypothetical protein [Paraliomyxa miuraensis]